MTEPAPLSPWDLFVLRHRKTGNLWVHLLSFVVFWGGLAAALALWNPGGLLVFAASGPIGAAGHYIFDDGGVSLHEATSSPMVVFYVTVMFYRIARGRYAADIAAADARLKAQQS